MLFPIEPFYSRGPYRITIPEDWEVFVSHVNGPVFINSIDSRLSVINTNGDVELMEIVGSARVNVVNGRIIGEVTLPLDGAIELATINGSVDSEIKLMSDGTIDVTVLHGGINLDIPQNTSAAFEACVFEGDIVLRNIVLNERFRTSHCLTGTLGDGSGDIRLETEFGKITVTGI